jgi:hypothetical protein
MALHAMEHYAKSQSSTTSAEKAEVDAKGIPSTTGLCRKVSTLDV